jgi:DegV family protein with EDD domain
MIRIVTDSTANLPPEIISKFGITVIPAHVIFGSDTYLDGVTMTAGEFYQRLSASDALPSTSEASVNEFSALYDKMLAAEPGTTLISVHISSSMSGFIASARGAAAQLPDAAIRIFDSRSVALGLGLMVREAARMACDDAPEADIIAKLEVMRDSTRLFGTFDTLEYLAKSGRIGRVARFMGGLFDLKPILTVKDGALDAYGRVRGRDQSIATLRDLLLAEAQGRKGIHLGVIHAACEKEAKRFADECRKALKPEVFIFEEQGPALGVYSGVGAIGVYWWAPPE